MRRIPFIIPALAFGSMMAIAACGTRTTVHPASSPARSYDPVCLEGVAVYDDFASVPHDYQEIAFITAEQNAVYTDKSQMITTMRKRAGERGGNGLVVNTINADKSAAKLIGEALGGGSAEREGTAMAIYMPSDTMRVKEACGRS
jgi:hypothetical protein